MLHTGAPLAVLQVARTSEHSAALPTTRNLPVNTQAGSCSTHDNKSMVEEIKMPPSREQKKKKNFISTIDIVRDQK